MSIRALALGVLLAVALASCAGSNAREGDGRVTGIVVLGPMCPVENVASPCPDRPLGGVRVELVDATGDVSASAISGDDGRFAMDAPVGDYLAVADVASEPARTSKPVDVHVDAGRTTFVTVPVDSGIR